MSELKNEKSNGSHPLTALINARLVDPETGRDEEGGLVIEEGLITDLGSHLRHNAPKDAHVIDCEGNLLCPGLIDMCVTTGEPGHEHRETLTTAGRAAAAGGVTTMVLTPNTEPVIDDVALVDFIQRRARDTALVHVHTMAAMTKSLAGSEMAELGLLKQAGAIGFSNGKTSIGNAQVMRRVLEYSRDFNALVSHHLEDPDLAGGGVINEGEVSSRLGLPGIPALAETIMVERDIQLAELTKGRYHAAQISCSKSLEILRNAKARGLEVTCGVSINHLTLNENDIGSYRTFLKLRPPLRPEDDRLAMIDGIRSGDIDVIVSAHDPKDADVKRRPFSEAAYGAVGLETLLTAALRLYHTDGLDLVTLLRPMTINPAKLLGLASGRLSKGAPADLIVVDIDTPWMVDEDTLLSRSKNTPFDEAKVQGRVTRTLVSGRLIYTDGSFT